MGAQKKEMIALAGSFVDKIAIIEKASGKQVFAYDLPKGSECNTINVTPKGNIIFSYKQGVKMIDMKGRTIWDFAVEAGQEAQTARLLDNGNVLVGVCASPEMRLIELSPKGKKLSEVNYDLGIENPHSQFRQVVKTAAGNYLVPVISQSKVIEINPSGDKIGEWKVPATPFSVKEIDGARLLVGAMSGVVEIDRATGSSKVVLDNGAIAGRTADTLRFGTEVARLANKGTMVSNWQGYFKNSNDSQLIELDSQGEVVYTFRDTSIMKNISGFYLFSK